MTPEQLEAHRVRFEQRFYAEFGLEPLRSGPGYVEAAASDAWQAYQWALDDVDRAQRAAPGVQGGEAHYLKLPDHPTSAWNAAEMQVLTAWGQLLQAAAPQQSAQPGGEAVKLVDSLLLEAEIFWWNDGPEGKSSDAMKAARDQVIVALSAAAQPVEAANGWEKGLDIRMSQGWKLKGGICPVLYTDTVNGYGVGRDDLWLATTDALKSAQPVEVQRVPLTDATQFEKDVARWMEKDGLTREQAECEVNYRTTRKALKSGLSAHGIKPTSSEGGA